MAIGTISVRLSGPLFDEQGVELTHRLLDDIRRSVADQVLVDWEINLEGSIRHSGPVYQLTPQQIERDGDSVVNDGWGQTNRLPYGPWLEGIGSRNSPVTRFPGYFSLHRAYTTTDASVDDLARPFVDEYVDRMNHE